jgi:peptidoglycan/LPS O-acetylase OafA/YrhL
MIPSLGSVLLAYLVLNLGGGGPHNFTAQVTGSPWLTEFWNFNPHLGEAIWQGVIGVFFNASNSYNTNLWTMQVELYGSFLVFGLLALFGNLRKRWYVYCIACLLLLNSLYLPFLLGLILCDIWVNYESLCDSISKRSATILLGAGILLITWHVQGNLYASPYALLHAPLLTQDQLGGLARNIGACCLIIAILKLDWLSHFFELRALQFLGRISFSMYLMHFIILYSLSCALFNTLFPHVGYLTSFALTFSASLPLILVVSFAYTYWVDLPSIGFSKHFGNWLLSSNSDKKEPLKAPTTVMDTP